MLDRQTTTRHINNTDHSCGVQCCSTRNRITIVDTCLTLYCGTCMSNEPQQTNQTNQQLGSRRFIDRSTDSLGLGPTPAQRSAELVPGLRAVITNESIANALTGARGKVAAQVFIRLSNEKTLRYVPARMWCVTQAARKVIANKGDHFTLVEVATGFSPRSPFSARVS